MITEKIRRVFVKDFKIPAPVLNDPSLFLYYLELMEPFIDSKTNYDMLCDYLNSNDLDESLFMKETKRLKYEIIDKISKNKDYIEFSKMDMDKFNGISIPNHNRLYEKTNNGKEYISIDLKKANFQSIKYANPNIVFGANSYEELLKLFNASEYHIKSKQIRQVIFGNLSPKRQQKIQKFIMHKLFNWLLDNSIIDEKSISFSSADELVINKSFIDTDVLGEINSWIDKNEFDFHVTEFKLINLHEDYTFMYKEYNSGKIEFKNVPQKNFCEVIKHFTKEKISEYDLLFMDDGRLSKFKSPLF
jgi:hypothetical protein